MATELLTLLGGVLEERGCSPMRPPRPAAHDRHVPRRMLILVAGLTLSLKLAASPHAAASIRSVASPYGGRQLGRGYVLL